MMTLNDYIALFSGFNRDKQRLIALATALFQQVIDLQAIIPGIITAFTPDTAAGEQLDAIGAILGLYRSDTNDGATVTDEVFRDYIKKKLILWTWDGTNAMIPEITEKLAEGSIECDNQNCTVSIIGAGTQPAPVKALYPVTAGVRVAQ